MNRANIKIEPMKVYYGEDVAQVQTIQIPADVSGSMNSKAVRFFAPDGTQHYFWLNINSAGVDPALSGYTAHAVAGATSATGATLAAATAAVLTDVTGFDATADDDVVTLINLDPGFCPEANVVSGGGFSVAVIIEGDTEEEMGYTDGDIDFTLGEQAEDVKSHQTGTSKLGEIQTGFQPKLKVNFKETSPNQLRKFLTKAGSAFPTDGSTANPLMGYGTSRQFQMNTARQKPLRLHPVILDTADLSRDVNFWLVYPKLSNLNFSGEKTLMVPVEFEVYEDDTKPDAISFFAIGDPTALS